LMCAVSNVLCLNVVTDFTIPSTICDAMLSSPG
jgi:hypothetical protein